MYVAVNDPPFDPPLRVKETTPPVIRGGVAHAGSYCNGVVIVKFRVTLWALFEYAIVPVAAVN